MELLAIILTLLAVVLVSAILGMVCLCLCWIASHCNCLRKKTKQDVESQGDFIWKNPTLNEPSQVYQSRSRLPNQDSLISMTGRTSTGILHSTPKTIPNQLPQINSFQSLYEPLQYGLDNEVVESKDIRYQRVLILKKKGSFGLNIPHILLQKHFLNENANVNANEAMQLSKSRGHYLTQNTVFENPSHIWKCTVVSDTSKLVYPETEVYVSEMPLQTYQCSRKPNNAWIVEDFGKKYAVFGNKDDHYHFIDESLNADFVLVRENQ